jgi:hypothetical protein
MAIIQLKDVAVTRINGTGNGLVVTESKTVGDREYVTKFTIWFDQPHGLVVGDVVSLSGVLSAKVGEPWRGRDGNERRSVEFAVNMPRIAPKNGQNGSSGAVSAVSGTNSRPMVSNPSQAQWDTHDETPF